eukprot:365957_1
MGLFGYGTELELIYNNNVITQMAQLYAREGREYLQYIYYPSNPKQTNGYECGDLCFAKAIELLHGNDPSTIEFGTAAQIRCHTALASLLITKSIKPYPKAKHKQFAYTPPLSRLQCSNAVYIQVIMLP